MKKIILYFWLMIGVAWGLQAQGVKFESGTWDEILTKARIENKVIFVDVYTQWCGPCKLVSTTIFPRKEIGDCYNKNFICYKVDAESSEGKKFVKKYPVSGYPTFFYITPQEEVVHTFTGIKNGGNRFIQEASRASLYARYGGSEKLQHAILHGTAEKEDLKDYYLLADEETKPLALNNYLSALSAEEIVKNDSLVLQMSVYDSKLMNKLVETVMEENCTKRVTETKRIKGGEDNPILKKMSFFFTESIQKGNLLEFCELLNLKKRLSVCEKWKVVGAGSLSKDILMNENRLVFATSDYLKMCYWCKNRTCKNEFKLLFESYMDKLMGENNADSLHIQMDKRISTHMERKVEPAIKRMLIKSSYTLGYTTANNIQEWIEYFWKLSPSDKKTKEKYCRWIKYTYDINPYNTEVAISAADLLGRIDNFKEAVILLETAIGYQKKCSVRDPQLLRELELKLWDMHTGKI